MPEITVGAIATLLSKELKPVNTRLHSMQSTLDHHTTMLDGLAKDVKTLLDEKTISAERIERIEHWAQLVGEKLGIRLEQ